MAALVFPASPTLNQRYPANPGTSGVSQWVWNGSVWNVVPPLVSLGAANQAVYNSYKWPATDGTTGYQLTTDGAGNLTWGIDSTPQVQALDIDASVPFDGAQLTFTLVQLGTATPFAPNPSTNIVVFLGGVPQTPFAAYSVTGTQITFTVAPFAGTTFYAISNIA